MVACFEHKKSHEGSPKEKLGNDLVTIFGKVKNRGKFLKLQDL